MNTFIRPPTIRMIKVLKECLEKEEANKGKPCLAEEMKSSLSGLYKRGFIETKMEIVDNKKLLCIYVTDKGKKLLAGLNGN
ncbi:MAG: hypothetical protein ABIR03_10595 [Ginsengibacter sp.]